MNTPDNNESLDVHKALDRAIELLDIACAYPSEFFETPLGVCQVDVIEFEKLEPR